MYFGTKNYLKSNHNHTTKHTKSPHTYGFGVIYFACFFYILIMIRLNKIVKNYTCNIISLDIIYFLNCFQIQLLQFFKH